ncbi:hypothetical protein FRZ44_37970 [Hypericibacter terrae]|uniref:Uncharacterized protein n=1 Tax=Hypericibacter terrae TaxID=2602015 RepID=A0A5J6MR10_9PROT|nr:hypothetical protein [Hypericibacter terrae]QEX18490.1 hypothetical protein FRZ44_37970 [Hypericibacter terrae]
MTTATRISNAAAKAACDAIVGLLDAGAGAATAKLYTTAQATDPDTAIGAQTLLGTLTFSDPAFGAAADANPGGRATASAITDDSSADATGTAAWFRCADSNGVAVIDGSVGTSGADMNLNTVAIVAGAAISITSWTVTMPEQ